VRCAGRADLVERFHAITVGVDDDADAGALAERRHGLARELLRLSIGNRSARRLVGCPLWAVALEEVEEAGDLDSFLCGVAHVCFGVDPVVVSSSLALAVDVASFDEVAEDALGGAFGDSDVVGDVAEPDVRVLGDGEQDLGVVGEECPGGDIST
jgi:hypothetical protein